MKIKLLFVAVLIMLGCNGKKKDTVAEMHTKDLAKIEVATEEGIALEIYDYEGLKPLLHKDDGKVHVVNFWATWCAPCVKELPYFEELLENYKGNNVEVLLVSLDFPHQYENKLKPFIKDKNLKSKVVVLDDADSNSWIPKVDKGWSGSIPATIIYKGDKRDFYEQSFTYKELEASLKKFLN